MYIPALNAAHFLFSLNKTIKEVENIQNPNVLELQ